MDSEQIIKINPEKFDKTDHLKIICEPEKFNWYRKSFFSTYIRSAKFRNSRNVKNTIEFLERVCFEVTVATIINRIECTDKSKIKFIQNHMFEPLTEEIIENFKKLNTMKPKLLITDSSIEFVVNEEEIKNEIEEIRDIIL